MYTANSSAALWMLKRLNYNQIEEIDYDVVQAFYEASKATNFKHLDTNDKIRASASGKRRMTKDGVYKLVRNVDIEKYMNDGWVFGSPKCSDEVRRKQSESKLGKVLIYKNNNYKNVSVSELSSYLESGWTRGFKNKRESSPIKGKIRITNGLQDIYILSGELGAYELNGWHVGTRFNLKGHGKGTKRSAECRASISASRKGRIAVHKGAEIKYIKLEDVLRYEKIGYMRGTGVHIKASEPRTWVVKQTTTKYIRISELEEYLSKGWKQGRK